MTKFYHDLLPPAKTHFSPFRVKFQFTPDDQKHFLRSKIGRDEGKGLVFDEEGWLTELVCADEKLAFDIKHLACIFSERLQVLDVSGNKLKGYASDVFSVACVSLRVLRLARNERIKGDIMEDCGKVK